MAAMAIARDGMRSRQPRGAREQAHRRWVLGHEWLAPGGGASWRSVALRTGFISDSDVVIVELQRVVVDLLAWTAFQGKAVMSEINRLSVIGLVAAAARWPLPDTPHRHLVFPRRARRGDAVPWTDRTRRRGKTKQEPPRSPWCASRRAAGSCVRRPVPGSSMRTGTALTREGGGGRDTLCDLSS